MAEKDKPNVVVMGRLGHVEEFDPDKAEAWPLYWERLDFFFTANNVVEDLQKRAVLCSVCGPATYAIIRSLCAPATPAETPYADIVARLTAHFTPRPSVIVQRFAFHKRNQQPGETIADFVAALRRLSEHCDFGETLSDMLRDRLVCGVRDEGVQRRLLAEPALDFKKAFETAVASEYASRQAQHIRGAVPASSTSDLHRIQQTPKGVSKQEGASKSPRESVTRRCSRCNGDHDAANCAFRNAECHFCKRKGHIVRACRQKEAARSRAKCSDNRPGKSSADKNQSGRAGVYGLYHITSGLPAFMATVTVNGSKVPMEVDSGSVCSIVNLRTMRKLGISKKALRPCTRGVRTYTQQPVSLVGEVEVQVKYSGREAQLPLLVTKGAGISILGRDWFQPLGISVEGLHQLQGAAVSRNCSGECDPAAGRQHTSGTKVATLLGDFPEVFKPELGKSKGPAVRIEVEDQATPKFHKARQVPFALLPKVDEAIEKLVEQGIYVPVKHSRWATPIVPILKKNGKMRICGDYKGTLNPVVKWETYPLPTPEQLLARLGGCSVFSRLDLDQAYQQLSVDEDTAMLLTVTTHKGLFKVTRLQFGVAVAVAIFQRYMEELLSGLEGVQCFLDDILIGGRTVAEHDDRLRRVLQRIQDDGLRLNADKCAFRVKEVRYLGYRINKDGVRPLAEKVEAIKKAPEPTNKKELQSFLGALNFYGRFLKGAAHVLEPLHRLLDKDKVWAWTKTEAEAYQRAKSLLESSAVLAHYDVSRPIVLACDASPCGLGAVLSQVGEDGIERPVAFASRTLSQTERNYAQIDREALALLFGVKKFHQYVFGRAFKLLTDHKPLLGLLHQAKPVPAVMSPRMLRWSLQLSAYNYELLYVPGSKLSHADVLSRLPLPVKEEHEPPLGDILLIEAAPEVPLDSTKIAALTRTDPLLSRVHRWILQGWPSGKLPENFRPFVARRNELSTYRGCILWGSRVVIPERAQFRVLDILHTTHPGVVRMKGLARSTVWWPGVDSHIERKVAGCQVCQETRHAPSKAPVHPWEFTKNPWSRLHIDFAGPFRGKVFLLVVDSHSKWLEVSLMDSMSTAAVLKELRAMFARYGIPEVLVSDNGTAFTSAEFAEFTTKNQIRHITVAPYHPSSNGQVERMVQETKQVLRKLSEGDWATKLSRFLLGQHTLPSTTTGKSPAELLMGRRLRTAVDRLHPDGNIDQAALERFFLGDNQRVRAFCMGDAVYARNYHGSTKWVPGVVCSVTGPLSYQVRLCDGRLWRRHIDQLRKRAGPLDPGVSYNQGAPEDLDPAISVRPDCVPPAESDSAPIPGLSIRPATPPALFSDQPELPEEDSPVEPSPDPTAAAVALSRPQRQRRPPLRYQDYVS